MLLFIILTFVLPLLLAYVADWAEPASDESINPDKDPNDLVERIKGLFINY